MMMPTGIDIDIQYIYQVRAVLCETHVPTLEEGLMSGHLRWRN